MGLAFALRALRVSDWSLWEDEGTSLYFSQHPGKPFPSYFPTFFALLHGLFAVTEVSVVWGRLLAAAFGVFSIWLTYVLGRRCGSRAVGLLGAVFLAVSLGHLFWSQSVRYYTLVLVFQLLCILWFLEGLECSDPLRLLLSNLAFALAMFTHFSTVILAPVLLLYLAVSAWLPGKEGQRRLKGHVLFGVPFLLILGFFAWRFLEFSKLNLIASDGTTAPVGQDVPGLAARVLGYFGLPVVVLASLAPLVARPLHPRLGPFLLIAGLLPLMELVVIGQLGLAIVAWYYAFFALPALAVLAALTLVSLHRQSYRVTAAVLGGAALAYATVFLTGYFTWMHGDRPRWQEAARLLRQTADIRAEAPDEQEIYATVPGVVAHYLGVAPEANMGHPLVKPLPARPPETATHRDRWFVVEVAVLPQEYARWLAEHCQLKGLFEARTGPKDRSILVYHSPGIRKSSFWTESRPPEQGGFPAVFGAGGAGFARPGPFADNLLPRHTGSENVNKDAHAH
jgi:hypothetical protein